MLVRHTLFRSRPKIAGNELHPLTAGRVLVLEELGNPLGTGSDGVDIDPRAVYEAFLVCLLDSSELEAAVQDDEDWKRRVRIFSLDTPDEDLNAFWGILQSELTEAAAKMTESVEKPKPPARKAGGRRK